MSQIIVLKLTDGADLMCTVVDDTDDKVILVHKARVALFQQNKHPVSGEPQVGIAFPPWSNILMDREVEIERSHIISTIKHIDNNIEKAYLTQTSGIDLGGLQL